jgi:hypothetical protein
MYRVYTTYSWLGPQAAKAHGRCTCCTPPIGPALYVTMLGTFWSSRIAAARVDMRLLHFLSFWSGGETARGLKSPPQQQQVPGSCTQVVHRSTGSASSKLLLCITLPTAFGLQFGWHPYNISALCLVQYYISCLPSACLPSCDHSI